MTDATPQIIFEDSEILVLNKPSGFTVNTSETTIHQQTIQDWVEKKLHVQRVGFLGDKESDFYKRAGIVHRLDKETSGILLVAKTSQSFENLQTQFKERVVEKAYLALAHGNVIPSEGLISVPVGRLEYNRKRFGVVAGGRESLTTYKVLTVAYLGKKNKKEQLSLLELYPKTGRTHQIRVHLKYLNYPIFSDTLYGGRKTAREDRKLLSRFFLHAAKISFLHPSTNEKMHFESPLPTDLKSFFDTLQVVK